METSTIILMVAGNFCVFPLLVFAVGVWVGRGMPGSPVVLQRRRRDESAQEQEDDYDYEELT